MSFSNTANSPIFSKPNTSVKASTGGGVIKKAISTDTPTTEEKSANSEGLTGENVNPEKATSEVGQSSTTKSGTAVASANKLSTSLPGLSAGSHISNQTHSGAVTNPGASAGSHLSNQNGNGTITPPSTGAAAPGTSTPGTITPPEGQASAPGTSSPGTITPPSSQPSATSSPNLGTSNPYSSAPNGLGLGGMGMLGGFGGFGGMPGLGGFGLNRNNANPGFGAGPGGGRGAQNGLNPNQQTPPTQSPQTQTPQNPEAKDEKKTDEKKTEETAEDGFVTKDKAGTFPDFIKGFNDPDPEKQKTNKINLSNNFDNLDSGLQEKIRTFIEKDLKGVKPDAKSYPKDLITKYEAINKQLEGYSGTQADGKSSSITKLEDLFKPLNITKTIPVPEAPKKEEDTIPELQETPENNNEEPLNPNDNSIPNASLDNDFDIESLV